MGKQGEEKKINEPFIHMWLELIGWKSTTCEKWLGSNLSLSAHSLLVDRG